MGPALPLIATIHAARLEARFIKAMAQGRAWLAPPIRGWDAEPEADPTATPHITTRADIEEVDRLRADLKAAKDALMDVADALGCGKHHGGHVERAKQAARDGLTALRATDIPQTHETHGD